MPLGKKRPDIAQKLNIWYNQVNSKGVKSWNKNFIYVNIVET